jgi:hypothetical protein
MEGDVVTLQDLFIARAPDSRKKGESTLLDTLESTNLRPGFLDKVKSNGVDLAPQAWLGVA